MPATPPETNTPQVLGLFSSAAAPRGASVCQNARALRRRSIGRSSTRDRSPGMELAPRRCPFSPTGSWACGQVLQAEQRQLEAIFHSDFLEQARQVNLYSAFGDHEGRGDLLVLQSLRQEAHQLSLSLRQSHAACTEEAVGQCLFGTMSNSPACTFRRHFTWRSVGRVLSAGYLARPAPWPGTPVR